MTKRNIAAHGLSGRIITLLNEIIEIIRRLLQPAQGEIAEDEIEHRIRDRFSDRVRG